MNKIKTAAVVSIGGICLAFLLFAGILPANVQAAVSPNVNLSKLTGYQGETTIAIDPTNPNRLFASSNMSTSALFAAYSTDGGTTWQYTDPTDKTIADGGDALPRACCDPIAVFDRFGNLYLTYLTNSPINVVVIYSTNGGQSFVGTTLGAESQVIGMFPLETGFGVHKRYDKGEKESEDSDALNTAGDQPTIAVGPSNVAGQVGVWVSWANAGIKVAGTSASGLGMITPFTNAVTTTPLTGNFGDIEVGANGQVMITAQTPSSGQGPASINISLDPDGLGPLDFNDPVSVPLKEKPFFETNSDVFGATILATATNVGGFDFIPAQPNRSVDAEADLSWDRTGGAYNNRVYLAYTDETVNENNDMDIRLRYSDNNGTTWSAPVRVNDDVSVFSQFFPRIEVDQTSGAVAVAFYDCRNDLLGTDATPNTETQVYGAVSRTGGTSFLPNELISQGTSRSASFANGNDYGDYNGLAFNSGRYYYIWADNSNFTADNPGGTRTSPDIYTARVTTTITAASVSVSGNVRTANGSGLGNAAVILTDSDGISRSTRTSSFGYYSFDGVEIGRTYTMSVRSRRYQFTPQIISVSDVIEQLNFTAQ